MAANKLELNESLTVRMYRGILGDCFLLTHKHGDRTSHILIDCGVLQGVEGAPDHIRKIARDIADTCNSALDLVVLTHEHHDHLSGFNYAHDIFFGETLTIKQLWLAWTENPADEQARSLRQRLSKAKTALALTAKIDAHAEFCVSDERRRQMGTVRALAKFIGPVEDADLTATDSRTGAKIIEMLKVKAGPDRTRYLEPGQSMRVRDDDGLRAFVLGPPRSEAWLHKDRPSAGAAKEVYLTGFNDALAVESAALATLAKLPKLPKLPKLAKLAKLACLGVDGNNAASANADNRDDLTPFALPHRRSIKKARQVIAKRTNVQSGNTKFIEEKVEELYFDSANKARTIDDDWLDSAEVLALKLDSDTNNTSLVLAFELSDGQVMLFPGDAQVGNWLSWRDQTYVRQDRNGQTMTVTSDDLLQRVTLYKVGHHASHNATLRALGLEKMTDPRLVAMISVVEEVAAQQGKGWQMPYKPLYDDLMSKTKNRVLRGDGDGDDVAKEKKAFDAAPTGPLPAELKHHPDGLWVQVKITAGHSRRRR